jgi:hypothetical protein
VTRCGASGRPVLVFVVQIRRYATDDHADPRAATRASCLQTYLAGCLAILDSLEPSALTDLGMEIRDVLSTRIVGVSTRN